MDSSEDAETFQAWLRWRQFPADCRGTAGRVVWAGLRPGQGGKAGEEYPRQYFYALGLGSQMVALKMSFLSALLSPGRVLHWPTSHYVNPLRCPSRSFGCYFAPITNCTLPPDLRNNRSGTPAAPAEPAGAVEDGRRLKRRSLRQRQGREREEDSIPEVCSPRGPGASRGRGWPASSFCRMRPASGAEHGSLEFEKVLWCTDTPRRRLSRLAGLRRVHSMAWYHAQLSAFLFRPNAELRAFRAAVAPTLERRGNASGPSAQSGGTPRARLKREARAAWPTAPTANLSCAAMHVRRTDKKTEDPRASVTRDFSVYSRAYRAWAFWVSTAPKTGHERVLLGSEDSATFGAMPPLIEPATTYFIPARHFVMDSSAGRAFQNIKQGNSRLAELYGLLEDEYEKEVKRGPVAAEAFLQSGALKDEGMALVLQILLMGECSSFFGSLSSNVGILVYDLQTALATRRRTTPYFFDANGRVYCGCGASFCMRLEKRSSKEPMRAYKDMVDAFHGDNAWAI